MRSPPTPASFVLSELVRHGRVRRAYVGVTAETVPVPRRHARAAGIDNATGAILKSVEQSGPGAAGGLMRDDLVVALDGQPVTGVGDLIRLLSGERIGRTVTVEVLRLGRPRSFEVTPSERPAPTTAKR